MKFPLFCPAVALASVTIVCTSGSAGAAVAPLPSAPLKVADVAASQAQEFPLSSVRLLDGPFLHAQLLDAAYLLKLEPERFLAWFRREAGLPQKAAVYPGWETGGIAGHSLGHYLSACALMYQATGNEALRAKAEECVRGLAECQKANGNGYVAAIPDGKRLFREIVGGEIKYDGFNLNGFWVPFYTIHKDLAGLRDVSRLMDNAQALEVERGMADFLVATLGPLNHEQMQALLRSEHGGINETLADLYSDTGDVKYLDLAKRCYDEDVLRPLAEGVDNLAGKHANTQIPKVIGVARQYELTGNAADAVTARFFWDRVANHHSYATGGNSLNEHFGEPDKLSERLGPNTTETCNVYNMLKLTEHLFAWSAEARYADFYERALYNHILASQHPVDGRVIYNLSLAMGGPKHYESQFEHFTCCVGTGMENHAKYGEAIYFRSADGGALFVNLFIASELSWPEKGLTVRQETRFPDEDTSRLVFHADAPTRLALRVRHPGWLKDGFALKVNGQPVPEAETGTPSSYVTLEREWRDGDTVEISLPRRLRIEAMPDNPARVAIFNGPLMLAGELGVENDLAAAQKVDFVPVIVGSARGVGLG